ncbi:hypothetical protein CRG98_024022 [Punica granatum]|uniref:Uncharacterized protein n=1 Tax=Punica granatum TaxID=22663 RepID=A0A2I0JH38_PUNGR|nr:hypothetical protein CRG98_024022 [Punica granatum]
MQTVVRPGCRNFPIDEVRMGVVQAAREVLIEKARHSPGPRAAPSVSTTRVNAKLPLFSAAALHVSLGEIAFSVVLRPRSEARTAPGGLNEHDGHLPSWPPILSCDGARNFASC